MTTDFSPVDLATARDRLRQLIIDLAVVRGRVTLASGIEADYYVDLRRVTLHHEASRYVGRLVQATKTARASCRSARRTRSAVTA